MEADERVAWLEDWVVLKLGVRAEKVRKLLAGPDREIISNFLEKPECQRYAAPVRPPAFCHVHQFSSRPTRRRLAFALRDNKELSCFAGAPPGLKRKAAFFTKLDKVALTPQKLTKDSDNTEYSGGSTFRIPRIKKVYHAFRAFALRRRYHPRSRRLLISHR